MCHGVRKETSSPLAPIPADFCWGYWPMLLLPLTLLLFPQPPAHGIHITSADGVPSAGHQGLWESLPGQPLGTQGILRYFPCSPNISTSRCCFSTPPSCCCKISLLGVASSGMTTGRKPRSFGISPNVSGVSVLSRLQRHQGMAYLLRVLQHLDCRSFSCQQLTCHLLWNKKGLLRPHLSFSSTLLSCQALAFDGRSKLQRHFFKFVFFKNSVL